MDEFSQFARMPAPRAVPTDLHALLDDALALYRGLLHRSRIPDALRRSRCRRCRSTRNRFAASSSISWTTPSRRWIAAASIDIETEHDAANNLVRVVVADNGPGIPPAERDKLFLPYYSTKQRGSGLGLAIVRRIVAEHGGSIDVTDNEPRGTRFAIELPC